MSALIIAGTRTFDNYELLEEVVKDFIKNHLDIDTILDGGAKGADTLGRRFAKKFNIETERHPALWNSYGNAAGPIRNKQMAACAKYCIVFWDGKSKGTASMINEAKNKKLTLKIVMI